VELQLRRGIRNGCGTADRELDRGDTAEGHRGEASSNADADTHANTEAHARPDPQADPEIDPQANTEADGDASPDPRHGSADAQADPFPDAIRNRRTQPRSISVARWRGDHAPTVRRRWRR
jgi:hypothetical protein